MKKVFLDSLLLRTIFPDDSFQESEAYRTFMNISQSFYKEEKVLNCIYLFSDSWIIYHT